MKEYRIVCTRRMVHEDGKEIILNNVAPWVFHHSLPHSTVYTTKADALKALRKAIQDAKKFDEETQERLAHGQPYSIGYWQSNFRLQSRSVSNWKD